MQYRGRFAPTPSGRLHVGHALTFQTTQLRAKEAGGSLVLRVEDLDTNRCRPEFEQAMFEDLRWMGFRWEEGPDIGGPFAPYRQSSRFELYREAFQSLKSMGMLYPCNQSRKDVLRSLTAPHRGDEEPVYPGTCRPGGTGAIPLDQVGSKISKGELINWRFLVPDGLEIEFTDQRLGPQRYVAGKDLGDFIVWRHDQLPSYHLAVAVDDYHMRISEVVRGEDLLVSTARQILLYRALGWPIPNYHHCPLVLDEEGRRLAKRHDALSLKALRETGWTPESIIKEWATRVDKCKI